MSYLAQIAPYATRNIVIVVGPILLLALLLSVYLWRHPSCCVSSAGSKRSRIPVAAALGGIVPNLLDCTHFIPSLMAVFLAGTALLAVSPPIQLVLNVYAWALYATAAASAWFSLRLTAKRYSRESLWREEAPAAA